MSTRERLTGLLAGFMPVQLVYVMARLRIADLLDGDSLTVPSSAPPPTPAPI